MRVNLGSDDPALFGASLTDEYAALAETFGYAETDLADLSLAGLEAAFLPPAQRSGLEQRMRSELKALGVDDRPLATADTRSRDQ